MRRSHAARRRGRARHEAEAAAAAAALTAALREAWLAGDPLVLARLLGPAVHVVVDAGGAEASLATTVGPACGAALLRRVLGDPQTIRLEVRPVNGRSGLVASREGQVIALVVPTGAPGCVDHLWVVADPAKLLRW